MLFFLVFQPVQVAPASTVLRRSSPTQNQVAFRSSFSNIYLVSSTGFAQSHVGPLCSLSPQLLIGAKRLHLIHHALACALRLPRLYCYTCLMVFIFYFLFFIFIVFMLFFE
jgi:uncharacterized membrane protein YhaH (DUF805 family)